jgi:hypothetical protein
LRGLSVTDRSDQQNREETNDSREQVRPHSASALKIGCARRWSLCDASDSCVGATN